MKRILSIAVVASIAILSGGLPLDAQGPVLSNRLTYFDTSFVTGDVVVGGVSLFRKGATSGPSSGFATQNIAVSGVPAGAEILSAYLYIQTTFLEALGENAGIAGATFKGNPLNTSIVGSEFNGESIAKALNWNPGNQTQACWSYGLNPRRVLVTYRADVLRFLDTATSGNPPQTKHVANGLHQVKVKDAGRVNIFSDDAEDPPSMTGPRAVGASLVLIYRDANAAAPLRAIAIYDGGVTKRSSETMTQWIQGVYDPTGDARMTHIVGDGQLLFPERTQFGSLIYPPNQFIGLSTGSFPRWDNRTFNLPAGALKQYPDASRLSTVSVTPQGSLTDCLSWSAIVVSSQVKDADKDGHLDLWESGLPSGEPILDPDGDELPDLASMGADPYRKDIFAEIGFLRTDGDVTYGEGAEAKVKPAHTHKPTFESLKMIHAAFDNAPVAYPNRPDGSAVRNGIAVHFDVGADPDFQQIDPDTGLVYAFIIPAVDGLAKGGQNLLETEACVDGELLIECPVDTETGRRLMPGQYPFYPGTVGWKSGFRFYRDGWLGFDPARRNIFRYVLFAHFLGLPQSEIPTDPKFEIPRTNSGIADWAGADALITLGGFDDRNGRPVGEPFIQAATLMHEWGHNFKRRHGGNQGAANCNPQYHSVLNYMYQMRGLLDDQGLPQLDYSRGAAAAGLNENGLADGVIDTLLYRLGWYAPIDGTYLENMPGAAASKHCDGSPLLAGEPPTVRLDALGVLDPIDWDGDGVPDSLTLADVNFDGTLGQLGQGSNDWNQLALNQIGARRNVGGLFINKDLLAMIGPMSLNAGKGDLGKGDLGKGDLGKGDLGKGDLGKGDLGKGDLGKGDLGTGAPDGVTLTLGKGDLGKGDLGRGDLDVGSGVGTETTVFEIDFETASAVTGGEPLPPTGLQACLTDDGEDCYSEGDRPVLLSWLAPNFGSPIAYYIYRLEDVSNPFLPPVPLPAEAPIVVLTAPIQGTLPTSYYDNNAPADTRLAYYVVARYPSEFVVIEDVLTEIFKFSGISNFATVTTPENDDDEEDGPEITSVTPDVGKPGEGLLVVRGNNLPEVEGSIAVVRGGVEYDYAADGIIVLGPSSPSAYFVRLPAGFPLGPATIQIRNGDTESNEFDITAQSIPGTPVITNVYRIVTYSCGPEVYCQYLDETTEVPTGQTIYVAADGIDTSGPVVRFRQGGTVQDVGASTVIANVDIGTAAEVTAPSLAPGLVYVSIKQGAGDFSEEVELEVPLIEGP